jgi:hypothetical protein
VAASLDRLHAPVAHEPGCGRLGECYVACATNCRQQLAGFPACLCFQPFSILSPDEVIAFPNTVFHCPICFSAVRTFAAPIAVALELTIVGIVALQ